MENEKNRQHTPGPWQTSPDGDIRTCEDTSADQAVIAVDIINPHDANLIAAAPDLLEALREASRALTLIDPLAEHHNATMIDNALAKARGGK